MTRQEQFRRNHELFAVFMQQVLDNPSLTRKIPKGAQVIFLPESDRDLHEANLKLGRSLKKKGTRIVYIKIKLVREVITVYKPEIEFTQAA